MSKQEPRTGAPVAAPNLTETLNMRPLRAVTAVRLVLRSLGDAWTVDKILDYFAPGKDREAVRGVLWAVLGSHLVILVRLVPEETQPGGYVDPAALCVVEAWEAIAEPHTVAGEPCERPRRIRSIGRPHVGPISRATAEAMAEVASIEPQMVERYWRHVLREPGDDLGY